MIKQAIAFLLILTACRSRPDDLPQISNTVLWAWERPEDLRFLDPRTTTVAFLARTITLGHRGLRIATRLQPLRYVPGTPLIAVIRLESDATELPPVSMVERAIRDAVATLPAISGLQIDFDARRSERAWYRDLLTGLPKTPPLIITALTSWCEDDGWIRDLPVSAAVPMLFRMGPSHLQPRTLDFSIPLCRSNLGLATDELPARVPRGRRLWFFHTRPWTAATAQGILEESRRRQ